MRKNIAIIAPDLSIKEAYKLVDLIKNGSDYAGMLVFRSLATTLKYVLYPKPNYTWLMKHNEKLS